MLKVGVLVKSDFTIKLMKNPTSERLCEELHKNKIERAYRIEYDGYMNLTEININTDSNIVLVTEKDITGQTLKAELINISEINSYLERYDSNTRVITDSYALLKLTKAQLLKTPSDYFGSVYITLV